MGHWHLQCEWQDSKAKGLLIDILFESMIMASVLLSLCIHVCPKFQHDILMQTGKKEKIVLDYSWSGAYQWGLHCYSVGSLCMCNKCPVKWQNMVVSFSCLNLNWLNSSLFDHFYLFYFIKCGVFHAKRQKGFGCLLYSVDWFIYWLIFLFWDFWRYCLGLLVMALTPVTRNRFVCLFWFHKIICTTSYCYTVCYVNWFWGDLTCFHACL